MLTLKKPLAFFDLETTGVSLSEDRIVQIAITIVFPDGSVDHKMKFINPGIPIPKSASDVHGITDEKVKDAPTFSQISKSLKDQLTGCDLAGYNSNRFDIPLLSNEFERCQIEFPDPGTNAIDIMVLESKCNSRELSEVYKRYTGKDLDNAHDAKSDTNATIVILEHQIPKLTELLEKHFEGFDGQISTEILDEFCQGEKKRFDFAGKLYQKDGNVFWNFGKNIDKPIMEDMKYLFWVMSNDFPSETKAKLRMLLEQKEIEKNNSNLL